MLRAILLYLSRSKRIRGWIPKYRVTRSVSRRFVAGERISDALKVIKQLREKGMCATLDILGENVESQDMAKAATEEYISALNILEKEDLPSGISVKLTHLGLDLSSDLALENLRSIIRKANEKRRFVRIDMESSQYTETTIRFYDLLRREYPKNVGIVFQANLYRTEKDIRRLLKDGPIDVRLCKGAYKEPPQIAYPKKRDVDRNYTNLLLILLQPEVLKSGAKIAIATHDEKILRWTEDLVNQRNLPDGSYEFQMLFGIRRDLQENLVRRGRKVRIYVPYGTEWYPYFMRRLAERPQNLLFVLRNLLKP